MSPSRCSHSGLSRCETASICGDRSTSVMAKACLRWAALLPPPLPSSSTVCRCGASAGSSPPEVSGADGTPARSSAAAKAASSAYSSGAETSGQ